MRRPGSDAPRDSDVMEVLLVEDETHDEFLELLHEIALAAVALRAVSPGDPRPGGATDGRASEGRDGTVGLPGGAAGRTRGVLLLRRWVAAVVVLLVVGAVTATVLDARSSAAAEARLAAQPGALDEMSGPPAEVGRISGSGTAPQVDPLRTVGAVLPGTAEHVLPDGTRVSWSWGPDGEFERGRVVVRRGLRGYPLPGPLLLPEVTDGSVPRTLVAVTGDGSHLRGIALVTGARLWSLPRAGTAPVHAVARVDGVLVLDEGPTVTALDVRTGNALWGTSVAPDVAGQGLTDGHLVLMAVRDDDGALHLVARRLTDGAEEWRTPLPTHTTALAVEDRRLVVTTGDRATRAGRTSRGAGAGVAVRGGLHQ